MSLTARDLNAALWAAADEMRQVMSADVYKDYLLGLVFYKALSDKILVEAYEVLNDMKPERLEVAQQSYEEAGVDEETWGDLKAELAWIFNKAAPLNGGSRFFHTRPPPHDANRYTENTSIKTPANMDLS